MSEHCVCSHAPNQHLHAPLGPWCMVPDCRCTGYKWACEQEDFRAIYQAEAAALRRFTRTSWMWIEYAAAVGLAYRHDSVNAVSGAVNAQWEKTSAAQAAEIAALKAELHALELFRVAAAEWQERAERSRAAYKNMEGQHDYLLGEVERLRGALGDLIIGIDDLISSSEGVTGLHLNGDIASWHELTDGAFHEWLDCLAAARRALSGEEPTK